MAFFFGGADSGLKGDVPGFGPPGDDGEGPGGFNFFAPPAGFGPPGESPLPGEPTSAEDLFMMFAGPDGDGDGDGGDGQGPPPPGGDGFRGFFGPAGDDGFGPPGEDSGDEPQSAGGITAVFGLTGGDTEPEESQQSAAQMFFFGEQETPSAPNGDAGDPEGSVPEVMPSEPAEAETFFNPQEVEEIEENTFFNPEAKEEIVVEEANFFESSSQITLQMPESTFFSPNELDEEEFIQQMAEEYGVDPRMISLAVSGD